MRAVVDRVACGGAGHGQSGVRGDMSGLCEDGEPVRAWGGGAGDLSLIGGVIGVASWKPDMSHLRRG